MAHHFIMNGKKINIALMTFARNEGVSILEWACYNKLLGFDDIYIYSHDNTDGSDELYEKLDEIGLIHYVNMTGKIPPLMPVEFALISSAFKDIQSEGKADWLAVIDVDEFIHLKEDADVHDFMDRYHNTNADAIAFPWKTFNANGQFEMKEGLLIDRFPALGLPNRCHKMFGRVDAIDTWKRSHMAIFKNELDPKIYYPDMTTYCEYNRKDPWREYNIIELNHYITKSYEEFSMKLARGDSLNFQIGSETPSNLNSYIKFLDHNRGISRKEDTTIKDAIHYKGLKDSIARVIAENDLEPIIRNIKDRTRAIIDHAINSMSESEISEIDDMLNRR